MGATYFSRNGEILPLTEAKVSLDDIAYAYGFGVYETLRVNHGVLYFAAQHFARLLASAETIGLQHRFSAAFVQKAVEDLLSHNQIDTANIKILLIGGKTKANLYILSLKPLFPDRKLYKTGVHCITEHYERLYPQAKTLNMLPSYLAYQKAINNAAYDALLINHAAEITEGTRTNFFCLDGKTIISPPATALLQGVMRTAVLQVARQHGFAVAMRPIPVTELTNYDAAFLTSTSTKIMPIRSIDSHMFGEPSTALTELIQLFTTFYAQCGGSL